MLAMETLNVNLNTSPLIFIEFFNRVFSLQINSEFADQTLGPWKRKYFLLGPKIWNIVPLEFKIMNMY